MAPAIEERGVGASIICRIHVDRAVTDVHRVVGVHGSWATERYEEAREAATPLG